ncbi:MAG: MBL fold metallo-hydrolase [Acidobacteriota bacterium]
MFQVKQLLAGRDFALSDPFAGQLQNFVYLVCDTETRAAFIVDPAWDIGGILAAAEREGMRPEGVLATHYHPDHVGGDLFGYRVEGLVELKERLDLPVHVHQSEVDGIRQLTGLSRTDLVPHHGDDMLKVGNVPIRLLHTPGHTPGSQCFLVGGKTLVSGDTLFIGGCGRVDLPGGDSDEMYRTLTQRLSHLPPEVVLLPGPAYGPSPSSTIGEERRSNTYLKIRSLEDWRRLMG